LGVASNENPGVWLAFAEYLALKDLSMLHIADYSGALSDVAVPTLSIPELVKVSLVCEVYVYSCNIDILDGKSSLALRSMSALLYFKILNHRKIIWKC
tara:strand:- start:128 stop:421 length:294 start_codon:yes stop_codon:yes gene_type:complete